MKNDPTWRQRPEYQRLDDRTAQGKELHRRMAARMMPGQWQQDVYVNVNSTPMTVVHVGPDAPGTIRTHADIQQVDHIVMKVNDENGKPYPVVKGQVWNPDHAEMVIDLKVTDRSWLEDPQLARLEKVAGGAGSGKLWTVAPEELYRGGQWVQNPRAADLFRAFSYIGAAASALVVAQQASAAHSLANFQRQLDFIAGREQDKNGDGLDWYEENDHDGTQRKHDYNTLAEYVVAFLSHFVVDDDPLQQILGMSTYALWTDLVELRP